MQTSDWFLGLFLEPNESNLHSVEYKRLRRSWSWLEILTLGMLGLTLIYRVPPMQGLTRDLDYGKYWTASYRYLILCACIASIVTIFVFTSRYTFYALKEKKPFFLNAVVALYGLSALYFGKAYHFLYLLDPKRFEYPLKTSEIMGPISPQTYLASTDFCLFSALYTVGRDFHKIQPTSNLISVIMLIQTIYAICLVGILIAGYVNQKFTHLGDS